MIKEKRKQRKKRKTKLVILLLLVCVVAIGAYVAVEGFTIKQVEVDGNALYTDKQIRDSVLNDEYSWNALYVTLKYRLFPVKEMPFVDEMEIELLSMHKIRINVYEKAIIGYLEANNQNVYFDKEGFVVEISKRLIEDVPRVEGLQCQKVVVYEKLNLDDNSALPLLLTFSQQLQKYSLSPDTIEFRNGHKLSADFQGVTIQLGDSEYLVEKVMRLDAIMPSLSGRFGTLHLENWTPLTKDVVFTPDKSMEKETGKKKEKKQEKKQQ